MYIYFYFLISHFFNNFQLIITVYIIFIQITLFHLKLKFNFYFNLIFYIFTFSLIKSYPFYLILLSIFLLFIIYFLSNLHFSYQTYLSSKNLSYTIFILLSLLQTYLLFLYVYLIISFYPLFFSFILTF